MLCVPIRVDRAFSLMGKRDGLSAGTNGAILGLVGLRALSITSGDLLGLLGEMALAGPCSGLPYDMIGSDIDLEAPGPGRLRIGDRVVTTSGLPLETDALNGNLMLPESTSTIAG